MVKKIKLRSTVLGLMPARRPDGEIRQTLTVLWDGRVWFKGETYTSVNRKICKSIGMEKAREVLDIFDKYFITTWNLNNGEPAYTTETHYTEKVTYSCYWSGNGADRKPRTNSGIITSDNIFYARSNSTSTLLIDLI